jgi:RND superfamily putative drug exporter
VLASFTPVAILRPVRVDDIFRAIGSFAVRFRWLVLIVWVAAFVAIPRALPSLSSVTQGNNSAFLPASAPSAHALELAAPFGITNGNTPLLPVPVIAAVSSGTLTPADQAWLATLPSRLLKVQNVVRVHDLGVSQPSASVPGQAAQFQVLSDVNQGDDTGLTNLIDNLRKTINPPKPPKGAKPPTATADVYPPPGMQVHVTGTLAINVDQQKQSGNTGKQVQLVSIVFILILLLLIFRAALAPIITLLPPIMSVVISGPIVAEAAHHGLKVSFLAQILLIVLVLGAGTDYGLFLVFRVRENMRLGQPSKEAVVSALTKVGESITFSAFTVIAALLSLLFATFEIYSNLGIPLAIGIGVTLLAGLTLLPALLAIFGRAAFWPSKARAGEATTGVWGRIAVRILKRPAVPLAIGVVVFAGLSVAVTGYESGGFGGSISAPAGTDSAAGAELLTKYFPQSASNPTNLLYKLPAPAWENPQLIEAATKQLMASSQFTGVTGPLNPVGGTGFTPVQYTELHALLGSGPLPPTPPADVAAKIPLEAYQLYRATTQFVDKAGTTIQFQTGLTAGDPSTTAAIQAVPAVRAEAATVVPTLHATDYGVGGQAAGLYDVNAISNSDLAHVIPIAILVIGVLLALVMRSLVAPLYLIASVALSYFAALGLAVILFIELGNSGGISFILPFLLFIFLLALGEDYNILVMTRIREEAHRLPLRQAVSKALGVTGTTVTSAGLVLAGTFAVFAIVGARGSGGSQFRDIGIGLSVGVIMDTFVVRTVLVPCTVVLLGRWNWWPSKLTPETPDAVGVSADALGLRGATAEAPAPDPAAGTEPGRRT